MTGAAALAMVRGCLLFNSEKRRVGAKGCRTASATGKAGCNSRIKKGKMLYAG
ncbi:uncharacterized protein EpC_32880 [Erwinia pyrifoliae Ep1/96]|nr:hypothetical protein EJP617_07760 [Erwinia sp. Ejp617]CAX57067.1 uncharacterized protein EpC_32880 [Erwinia pyrifoliae Ep1/96]